MNVYTMYNIISHFSMNIFHRKFIKIIIYFLFRYRLQAEYGNSIEFSELWDKLQNEGRCCGIIGPQVNKRTKFSFVG